MMEDEMVMTVQQKRVDGSTYTIVDDYGSVYVVLWDQGDGRRAYLVRTPSAKWGTDPVLGDAPLGEFFPYSTLFGVPILRGSMVYCHRDYSRWKRFVGWNMYHNRSPSDARRIAQRAALKYQAEQAA